MKETLHPVVHHTFVIARTYPQAPSKVFKAFQDPVIKRRWFVEGEGWTVDEYKADFRVGGREMSRFRFQGGPPMSNDTTYEIIIPDKRMVFTYTMGVAGELFSVSLATLELIPAGSGTKLQYTEQGTYFDGTADHGKNREIGSKDLFEKLAAELQSQR